MNNVGYSTYSLPTYHQDCFKADKKYEEEREWVKSFFNLASFIDKKSITVNKALCATTDVSYASRKDLFPTKGRVFYEPLKTKEDTEDISKYIKFIPTPDSIYGSTYLWNIPCIYWAYVIRYKLSDTGKSITTSAVTPEDYIEGLRFFGNSEEAIKKFKSLVGDIKLLFNSAEWCEVVIGASEGSPPTPYKMPIGLDTYLVTKLLQRMAYEGIRVEMPGMITSMRNDSTRVIFSGKLQGQIGDNRARITRRTG